MAIYSTEPVTGVPTSTEGGVEENKHVIHAITAIEMIVLVIGAVGNTMLFILMRGQRMKKFSFSVYFSFAAIFDTSTILWNGIEDAYELTHSSLLEEDVSRSYTFGCAILEQFDGWFPTTSAWLVVAVCVDRYISVCHQSVAQTFCRQKVALLVCFVLISFTFLYEMPWTLIFPGKPDTDDTPFRCGQEPSDNLKGLEFSEDYVQVLIPVTIVTVLNIRILVTLTKKKAFRDETSLTEHGRIRSRINMYNVTIFYLLVITVLAWLPWMIVNMIITIYFDFEGHDENTEIYVRLSYAWHASLVLWLFTFAQNFYVLMVMSPVYRHEFKRQYACPPWCRKVPHERFDVNDADVSRDDDEDETENI